MQWFRFYADVVNDPKVQRLSPTMFRHWVNVLCIASMNGGAIPPATDLAFALRISEGKACEMLDELVALHLLDADEEGLLTPHNWRKRQYDEAERSESGSRGNHVRWHVKAKAPIPSCSYCIAEGLAIPIAIPIAERVANRRDSETDTEQNRTDTEADAEDDASPPEHPFALLYAQKFRARNSGRPCPMTEHAAALALEREYGADACIQAAQDYEWAKHPNYLRPVLQERRDGKPRLQAVWRHASNGGQRSQADDSIVDDVRRYLNGEG